MCPYLGFFLFRIFPYSDLIRRDTRNTLNTDTFHAVILSQINSQILTGLKTAVLKNIAVKRLSQSFIFNKVVGLDSTT